MTSLLNPISDFVGRDVILLGQVARADVILQHFPHDPSALLQGKGRSIDGAAGINIGFGPWGPVGVICPRPHLKSYEVL